MGRPRGKAAKKNKLVKKTKVALEKIPEETEDEVMNETDEQPQPSEPNKEDEMAPDMAANDIYEEELERDMGATGDEGATDDEGATGDEGVTGTHGEETETDKTPNETPNDNHGEETETVPTGPATEKENETPQKRKRQRGPTKMKNIARDPNIREKVDFTDMGEAYGPGSVKLSSYLGPLVREHVPYTIENWKKVGEDMKLVLWKSVQARFELDEEYQKTAVLKQMGCLWRSSKSRMVTDIRNCKTNVARMDLRPKNVSINEWRKFIRLKTSKAFQIVSDEYRERRLTQIPHTCSRKGMVRLAEEMKRESQEPSKVTRLKVWVKSRTKKDGTAVNMNAAEKIRKAADLENDPPSGSTNPREDGLSQVLGPDKPGRLRAMGRGMSMTKLAFFQIKNKSMSQMQDNQTSLQRKVEDLEAVIARMKRGEAEVGENSGPRSVNRKAHSKCVLVDWCGCDGNVAEGRLLSSDPEDFVNDIPLGPNSVKVLVETAIKPDAFLWRPLHGMSTIEQAVGEMVAWPANNCVVPDSLDPQDSAPKSPSTTSSNKCKLMNWTGDDEIIAEGRWQSQEPKALVNGLPLGPNAVKIFVDMVHQPETFLWRPTKEMSTIEDCLKCYVAWPANRVIFVTNSDVSPSQSQFATPQAPTFTTELEKDGSTPSPPAKKAKSCAQSPVRRSPRKRTEQVRKENQKCMLMDLTGKKRVVAEGRFASDNPNEVVHCVPLGPNAVRVWVDIVKVRDVEVWRPSDEFMILEDAIGSALPWPKDKVVFY